MKNLLILTLFFISTLSQAQEKHTIKLTQRVRHRVEDVTFYATVVLTPAHSYGGGNIEFSQILSSYKLALEQKGIAFNKLKEDEMDYLLSGYEKEGASYRFETTELEELKTFIRTKSLGLGRAIFGFEASMTTEVESELTQNAITICRDRASRIASTMNKTLGGIVSLSSTHIDSVIIGSIYSDNTIGEYVFDVMVEFEILDE